MKVQIDTIKKVIKIEDEVGLNELFDFVNKILPDEWKEYKVLTNTTIDYVYPWYWNWSRPWYGTGSPVWSNLLTTVTGDGTGVLCTSDNGKVVVDSGSSTITTGTYGNCGTCTGYSISADLTNKEVKVSATSKALEEDIKAKFGKDWKVY